MKKHESHPQIIARLKRAHGHLDAVVSMMVDGKPCREVAQQLQAVENAIANAKRELIQDHIEHCLDELDRREAVREFQAVSRYL
jgi:uncharacterized protein